ncbi:glycosyltransferase, partial [candidate division WWE3 bacterium]|nr:glycosyltransferase [candidate division WWE3 bacterium]
DHRNVSDLDFDDGKSQVADFFDHRLMMQNFMRRGIMYADAVNAVSPTYAREIMKTEYGEGLDRLLTEVRSKVSGILNGIDYTEYNPATDKLVPTNFDSYSLEKRVENKIALQKEFDLKADKNIPIFSYVGRLEARQKGLDLLLEIIPPLMRDFQVQFVFVGGGDVGLAERIRHMHSEYPEMIGTHLMLDYDLPRLVFSGTDFILMPSRFEPCGLSQMEGMRYGAIPVVHNTGGLADSVEEYKPEESSGFGFVFRNYDPYSLFAQIVRSLETFRQDKVWHKLQMTAMGQDNSWEERATEYTKLYNKALQLGRRKLAKEGKLEI